MKLGTFIETPHLTIELTSKRDVMIVGGPRSTPLRRRVGREETTEQIVARLEATWGRQFALAGGVRWE